MAGEWIKVTTNLSTKPEVFRLARLIGKNVDHTVGTLFRFWCWADLITVDGVVDGVVAADVDAVVKHEGFCDALAQTGWLEYLPDGAGIRIPKFERHNGESAKKRALKSERQARWRSGKVDEQETGEGLHKRLPEKRREEKKETNKEGAFALPDWVPKISWDGWVEVRRKNKWPVTDRAFGLAVAELEALKNQGHDPAKVIDLATLKGWRSFYPPKSISAPADDPYKGVTW